jgi:hypothetical protein
VQRELLGARLEQCLFRCRSLHRRHRLSRVQTPRGEGKRPGQLCHRLQLDFVELESEGFDSEELELEDPEIEGLKSDNLVFEGLALEDLGSEYLASEELVFEALQLKEVELE